MLELGKLILASAPKADGAMKLPGKDKESDEPTHV